MTSNTRLRSKWNPAGVHLLAFLTLSAVFTFSSNLFSAEHPLEQFLESDVGLCIRTSRLNERIHEFQKTAFYTSLKNSKFYESWKNHKSHIALQISLKKFEEKTGYPLEELIDEFVGQSACLVISPDKENPKKTVAIFLAQIQNSEHIDRWLTLWKKENPNLKRKTKVFNQHEYVLQKSTRKVGNETVAKTQFYTHFNSFFVLTDSEEDILKVMKRIDEFQKPVIDRSVAKDSLNEAGWFRSAIGNLSKKSVCQIVVNPRVWDNAMEDNVARINFFSILWKSSDVFALGFQFHQGPVVEAYVGYRFNSLPNNWQKFVNRSQGENDFLKHIPADAIFFGSGRHDLSMIVRSMLDVASSTEGRKLLRYFQVMDLAMKSISRFEKFLPALKNNWGMFLVARDSQNDQRMPVDGLVALEVPKSKFNQTQMAARLLLEGMLKGSFEAISHAYNAHKPTETQSRLNSEETKDGKLTWIDSIASYHPAFAMTSRYLLVSGSPDLIRHHIEKKGGNSVMANPRIRNISQIYFKNFSQILFLNTSELVSLLDDNKDYFTKLASHSEAVTVETAKKRLAAIQDFFNIAEAMFITMNVERTGFKLTLGAVRTGSKR